MMWFCNVSVYTVPATMASLKSRTTHLLSIMTVVVNQHHTVIFSPCSRIFTIVLGFLVTQILQLWKLTDPRSVKWALSVYNTLNNHSLSSHISWNTHTTKALRFRQSTVKILWWLWILCGFHCRVYHRALQTVVRGMPVQCATWRCWLLYASTNWMKSPFLSELSEQQ